MRYYGKHSSRNSGISKWRRPSTVNGIPDAVSTYEEFSKIMLERLKSLAPCILPGGKGQAQIVIGEKYTRIDTIKGNWPILRTGVSEKYEEWAHELVKFNPDKFKPGIIVYQRKRKPGSIRGLYKTIDGDVVYFIGCKELPFVKIGTTIDVDKRLTGIQTSMPYDLEVLFCIPGDTSIERKVHKHFFEYKARGEWYKREGFLEQYIEYMSDESNAFLEPWEFTGM